MSDVRLRELERAAAASGSVDDRAAVLRERVRVGELAEGRVELAAHLGDEAAVAAVGSNEGNLAAWAGGLARWGMEAVVRVMVAAGREVLEHDEVEVANAFGTAEAGREKMRTFLGTIDEWLASGMGEQEFDMVCNESSVGVRWGYSVWYVLSERDASLSTLAKEFVVLVGFHPGGEGPVRRAVRAEVAPWALGERDPVRERVEAHRG